MTNETIDVREVYDTKKDLKNVKITPMYKHIKPGKVGAYDVTVLKDIGADLYRNMQHRQKTKGYLGEDEYLKTGAVAQASFAVLAREYLNIKIHVHEDNLNTGKAEHSDFIAFNKITGDPIIIDVKSRCNNGELGLKSNHIKKAKENNNLVFLLVNKCEPNSYEFLYFITGKEIVDLANKGKFTKDFDRISGTVMYFKKDDMNGCMGDFFCLLKKNKEVNEDGN